MKPKIYLVLVCLVIAGNTIQAQTINWSNLRKTKKHILQVNAGLMHGFSFGAGYSYKINERLFPAFLHLEHSFVSGGNLLEDFKSKAGGSVNWVRYRNFHFSTGVYGVFRRFENDFARLSNFGSEVNGVAGYYRKKWFAAAEAGFDKAIVTHFKHSAAYKSQYPGVVNGWYEPSTGGNFYYGFCAGISMNKHDLVIRIGKTLSEDFKTEPLVPLYGQIGFNWKF